jgi:HlyD family secretion protein
VPEAQANLYLSTTALLPVEAVHVVLGQPVREGDVLARLDSGELELAVTQAEQSVRAAQLALAQLLAPPRPEDLAVAEANLRVARNQVYAASQGNSPEAVQMAYLNLRLAQNALDQTHARMEQLVELGRYADKQALEGLEQEQVEAARIADQRYHAAQAAPGFGNAAAALAAVEQAQVALDALKNGPREEDVAIARLQLDQAQARLEQAVNDLTGAELVAPFDGIVAALNLRVGEGAAGTAPAVVLVDVSTFHLDVAVDEVDVARVAAGQAVTITLDALPDQLFSGAVERIAQTSTVNQGVVSYQVRIHLRPSEASLRGGMTATAEIVVDEARDVVLVPNWAIRRDRESGQTFVGLWQDGRIEDVLVELGLRNEAFSEVKGGVAEGDTVAVDTRREQFRLLGGGE